MKSPGNLYVVATPIGNLADISGRALEVLQKVDVIAAEDTRHSRKLLNNYGIKAKLVSHHQHNESKSTGKLIERLIAGENIAFISDAGTPLISDPGALLVKKAHLNDIRVIPIPGASALSSALSVCGFEIRKFHFEGFLPARRRERIQRLQHLAQLEGALVFFETPHRILESLKDMTDVLGVDRDACVAREMTKLHENILTDTLEEIATQFREGMHTVKGEFVLVISPGTRQKPEIDANVEEILKALAEDLTPRKTAEVASKVFGVSRNALYRRVLELQDESTNDESDLTR